VDIREEETVETAAPVARQPRLFRTFLVALAVLLAAAAATIAFSPALRRRFFAKQIRPITLAVTSTPEGADVFIDERPAGATPTGAELLPGSHDVRIVRRGYKPWHRVVDPRSEPDIAAQLEPLELAALFVESQPNGARVFLDDSYRGTTPLGIRHVEAGPHTIRVAKDPVYQAVTERVELKAGETRRLVVQLESNLERLYLSRIKKHPAKLTNYTELIHIYVGNSESAKAVGAVMQALEALKTAQPETTELSQFYEELRNVYRGRAGTIDQITREKLLDSVQLLLERMVKASPSDYTTYRSLILLLSRADRHDAVLKICDKVGKGGKTPGSTHFYIARLYLSWGEPKHAIPLLERAVKLRPSYYSARYYLASAYHRDDRLDDALREYQAAEKLAPKSSTYYQGLLHTSIARLLAARKDIKGAVARYKKALGLKLSPSYAVPWRFAFATLLAEHGRKKEAIQQYKEVVRLSTSSKLVREARRALRRLQEQ